MRRQLLSLLLLAAAAAASAGHYALKAKVTDHTVHDITGGRATTTLPTVWMYDDDYYEAEAAYGYPAFFTAPFRNGTLAFDYGGYIEAQAVTAAPPRAGPPTARGPSRTSSSGSRTPASPRRRRSSCARRPTPTPGSTARAT